MLLLGFGNEQRFFQKGQLHLLPPEMWSEKIIHFGVPDFQRPFVTLRFLGRTRRLSASQVVFWWIISLGRLVSGALEFVWNRAVFLQSAVPCFHACGLQVYCMSKSKASFIQFHSNSRLFAYLQTHMYIIFNTALPCKEKRTTLAPFWTSVVHPKPSTFLAGCWAKAYPGSEMGAATPGGATAATSEAAVEEKAGNVGRANWIQIRLVLMFDSLFFLVRSFFGTFCYCWCILSLLLVLSFMGFGRCLLLWFFL